ncbi:MAG: GNAT family N-acetyltransferase [Rhodothermales bacterium]
MLEARFLEVERSDVRQAWADLLAASPQRTPFSTLAYAEALHEALGVSYRLAGVYEGETLAAGALLYERPLGPYRRVVIPPLTPYTPVLLREPLREVDVHARRSPLDALVRLLESRYHHLALHLHPSLKDVRAFQWAGWSARPFFTYRQALGGADVLRRTASRNVRRLAGSGSWHVAEAPDAVEVMLSLGEASFNRQERSLPVEAIRLRRLMTSLLASGLARLFTASQARGVAEGALVVLRDGTTAHDWFVGSRPGPARACLTYDVLLQLHDEGVRCYDFGGANTPSIAEFKRRFGGTLTPYYRVERYTRPELRLLDLARRR